MKRWLWYQSKWLLMTSGILALFLANKNYKPYKDYELDENYMLNESFLFVISYQLHAKKIIQV
jgi:hypothetical protein